MPSNSEQSPSFPVAGSRPYIPVAAGSLRAHLTGMDQKAQWGGDAIGRMPNPMDYSGLNGFDERVRHDMWSSPFPSGGGGGRVLRVPGDFPTVEAAVAAAGPLDRVQTHQTQQQQSHHHDAGQRTDLGHQTKADKRHPYDDANQWKW